MFKNILQSKASTANKQGADTFLLYQADGYLKELQLQLDDLLDKRLVRTFFDVFMAILAFRNRAMGLLLSELGGYVCGFDHAPAGTKRISNLLRSKKWTAKLINQFLFNQAKSKIEELQQREKRPLLLWDDSRLEKPESWFTEGLCSVWSSKGKRLTKIKKGYYRPPVSRICVPGFEWTAVLLSALGETPRVCQMYWWTTRGKFKELGSNLIYRLLKRIDKHIGRAAVHIMDRGYANSMVVEWLLQFQQDFLIRWKKNHLLINQRQEKKQTHLLARSYRARASRLVRDQDSNKYKRLTIAWAAVQHPELGNTPLYLVIVRDKHGHHSPMYLLTSVPVECERQAWEICFSYLHRWHIEQAFRVGKSELAMESPRLWFWENRLKLLGIVTLAYDFLLRMLQGWMSWVRLFLKNWCHRTGNRYRKASVPIYRLRQAMSNCLIWALAQNSG